MPRGRRSQLLACAVGGLVLSSAAIEKSSLPGSPSHVADTVNLNRSFPRFCFKVLLFPRAGGGFFFGLLERVRLVA